MRIVAASAEARGYSRAPAERCREQNGRVSTSRASGAHLTGQCQRGQCQDGPSRVPATRAVPRAGSRTARVQYEAAASLGTTGRVTHRGEFDECFAF